MAPTMKESFERILLLEVSQIDPELRAFAEWILANEPVLSVWTAEDDSTVLLQLTVCFRRYAPRPAPEEVRTSSYYLLEPERVLSLATERGALRTDFWTAVREGVLTGNPERSSRPGGLHDYCRKAQRNKRLREIE